MFRISCPIPLSKMEHICYNWHILITEGDMNWLQRATVFSGILLLGQLAPSPAHSQKITWMKSKFQA